MCILPGFMLKLFDDLMLAGKISYSFFIWSKLYLLRSYSRMLLVLTVGVVAMT